MKNVICNVNKLIELLYLINLYLYKKIRRNFKRFVRKIKFKGYKALFMFAIIFTIIIIFIPMNSRAKTEHDNEINDKYKYFEVIYVKSGDSLWSIAKEHKYSESTKEYIEEVIGINNLKSENLYAGQMLVIPYYTDELK